MHKGIITTLVVLLLAMSAYANPFTDDNGVTGGPDGTGSGSGSGGPEDVAAPQIGETSYLEVMGQIKCENPIRDPGGGWRTLYKEMEIFYDGTAYAEFPGTNYPWTFSKEFEICEDNDDEFVFILPVCHEVGWPDDWLRNLYPVPDWDALPEPDEPSVIMNPSVYGWPGNEQFFRLEGNCRTYTQVYHEQYPMHKNGMGPPRGPDNPYDGFCMYVQHENRAGSGTGFYPATCAPNVGLVHPLNPVPAGCDFCNFDVDWDNNQAACNAIGGDWLEGGGYDGYRCCGDDWIWVYNRPLSNYDPSYTFQQINDLVAENNLCIYSDTQVSEGGGVGTYGYGYDIPVEGLGSYSDNSYRCKAENPRMLYTSYDPMLDEEGLEGDNDIRPIPDPLYPFNFIGVGAYETDVGKWSDGSRNNPQFCYHEFNDAAGGEKFEWLSIADAANKHQIVCEAYLGYNWTGSQCCGYDTSTYNDESLTCKGWSVVNDILASADVTEKYGSPYFESMFMSGCADKMIENPINPACFEGNTIPEFRTGSSDGIRKEVFNEGGKLYFCERGSGAQVYTSFDHKPKCTVMGLEDTAKSVAVCGYQNDSWYDTLTASSYMGYDTILAASADVQASVQVSEFPIPELIGGNIKARECCFFDSCWNGTKCVGRDNQLEGVYQYHEGAWKPYDWGDEPEGIIYLCTGGDWMDSAPMYNWYFDTRRPNFCTNKHSCVCPDQASDPGYQDNCDRSDLYETEICTKDPNYYNGDHYCEAVYEGTEIQQARWTSRTKLIALQLIELAGDNDYTLYCDKPENGLNYPEELTQARFPHNNICVIEYNGYKAIGLSFNPEDDVADPMEEYLFASQSGFVNRILGQQGTSVCPNDVVADTEKHGAYAKCIEGKLFTNDKTNSIIYSKRGISFTDNYLPTPDYNEYDNLLDNEVSYVSDFLATYPGNLVENIHKLVTASDFKRIYMKTDGDKYIFGYVEERYDRNAGVVPLSNHLAVHYHNWHNVCEDVDFVNNIHYADLACGGADSDYFVVQKSPVDYNITYWQDLTSKIRVE